MTPNNEALRDLVRSYVAGSPYLSGILETSDHSAWPYSHTSCRTIGGGSNWSRHAWGDAGDNMRVWKGQVPSPNIAPASFPNRADEPGHLNHFYLDEIYYYLLDHRAEFDLDNVIYRRRRRDGSWDHRDHIHADFRHHGTGTPPCAGGALRTVNPSGGFVLTMGGTTPPGGENVTVEQLQTTLTAAGYDPGPIDDIWGSRTAAAWEEMMRDARAGQAGGLQYGDAVRLATP